MTQGTQKKYRIAGLCMGLTIIILGVALFIVTKKSEQMARNPFPKSILTQADFEIYYSRPLPDGFSYAQNSAQWQGDIFYYHIQKNGGNVILTQQAKPDRNLMLDSVVGLSPIKTASGTAYTGRAGAAPVAILETKTSLINISGDASISQDIINSIAQNLQEVQDR